MGGVSKEAVAIAVGYLTRHGFATINPERAISLSPTGWMPLTATGVGQPILVRLYPNPHCPRGSCRPMVVGAPKPHIWPRPGAFSLTRPQPCPGIPWSCTAAAGQMAARPHTRRLEPNGCVNQHRHGHCSDRVQPRCALSRSLRDGYPQAQIWGLRANSLALSVRLLNACESRDSPRLAGALRGVSSGG
jgi:hypothetical protein